MILYYNGKISTCDRKHPYAQAMIVDGRCIVWVGNDENIPENEYSKKIDLGGRRVLPGFIDNHMHPVTFAEYNKQISILPPDIMSIEQLIEAIQKVRETTAPGEWIQGWGFDEGKLAEGRTPNRYDLDQGASDVPVSIVRACQHIRVVNSKALEICGIDAHTPDPEGGQIDRDEKGEPTGILRENARLLVPPFIPKADGAETVNMLVDLGNLLASQGIVAIGDLGSLDGTDNYERYRKAITQGFRQDVAMYCMWEDYKDDPDFHITPEQMAEGQQLRICGLKILGDGTFSGRTAWMEEPYPGTDEYGMSTCSDELLESAIDFCKKHHCQLALHAMGRRTIRRFVDRLAAEENFPHVRMEHVTDPAPESIAKAAKAGIAWSTQPIFLYSEIESYLANLAEDWTRRCYPIRSILEAGVPLSLSTDSPATAWATPSDPLVSIKAAATRVAYDGTDCSKTADGRDERIDVETAIRLYTSEAAKTLGLHDLGRIAAGCRASFVVLDKDILTEDDVHIIATYINGERVV
ncbi:MAG: amidohydrolase [Clostridia bacterium]|nr:amidohydrolase [Clostridia bacterium]